MLSRNDAIGLLAKYGKGASWTRHCAAVADLSEKVGDRLSHHRSIDRHLLWSTALLHDIGRCVTHDPIMHGVEGYRLLTRLGHHEAAFVCASHILFGLNAAEAARFGLPARDFLPRTIEERLVPLIDFLIEHDRATTLDRRFSSLRRRNADNVYFLSGLNHAYESAKSLMTELSEEIGESVETIVCRKEQPYRSDTGTFSD